MWSVRFKWLYLIFLVIFTAVTLGAIVLALPTQADQLPRYIFIWVVISAGILLWWYNKGKQARR